jgi:hypothetical protein
VTRRLDKSYALAPLVLPHEHADRLLAEESVSELPSLPRRQPRPREHLHDFICDTSLFRRKRRRIGVPAQARTNVRMEPPTRACELVSEVVQLAHLFEQRLELRVVDGHDRQHALPGESVEETEAPMTDRLITPGGEGRPEALSPTRTGSFGLHLRRARFSVAPGSAPSLPSPPLTVGVLRGLVNGIAERARNGFATHLLRGGGDRDEGGHSVRRRGRLLPCIGLHW